MKFLVREEGEESRISLCIGAAAWRRGWGVHFEFWSTFSLGFGGVAVIGAFVIDILEESADSSSFSGWFPTMYLRIFLICDVFVSYVQ